MEPGKHRVLRIGRGPEADVRLDHPSVSRLHLELVVGAGGEIHVADCSSTNGTWRFTDGAWQPVTACAVSREDRLRLGEREVSVAELLKSSAPGPRKPPAPGPDKAPAPGPPHPPKQRAAPAAKPDDDELPHGEVRRDPETGEVIPG